MTGAAGGKLLLFGEHAAVYGRPAVGVGVPWRLQLRFTAARAGDEPADEPASAERLRDACRRIGAGAPPAGTLEVRSEIPLGVGLGSSAALCVALARAVALAPAAGRAAARGERSLWSIAHRAEHAFHGSPSGIDTGLALLGGVRRFTLPAPGRLPAAHAIVVQGLYLIAGFVPRRGDTAAHVAAVRRRMRAGDDAVRSAIDRLGAIVAPACELLAASAAADRAVRLGALADEADELLAGIGVGSPAVAGVLAAARSAGATGGKISGGGGGGAFVAFVPDRGAGLAALDAVGESLPAGESLPTGASLPGGAGAAAALLAVEPAGVTVLADRCWPAPVVRRIALAAA